MPESFYSELENNPDLRPLLRMRRLAQEIREGLARGEMEIVGQAAQLLAPALAEWHERRDMMDSTPDEAVQLAQDTQALLNDCEQTLHNAMNQIAEELRRIKRAQKSAEVVRVAVPAMFGFRLNIER